MEKRGSLHVRVRAWPNQKRVLVINLLVEVLEQILLLHSEKKKVTLSNQKIEVLPVAV
jgi:hypothetical protein